MGIFNTLRIGSLVSDATKKIQELGEGGVAVPQKPTQPETNNNTGADTTQNSNGTMSTQPTGSNNTGVGANTNSNASTSTQSPAANDTPTTYDPAVDAAYQSALSALMQAQNNAPVYNDSFSPKLQDVYNQIVNREKFSFDINSDAMYQQMKDQYIAQGKLAAADTMGQAAAMNGGYGSSYGQSVGQQAYQGYMQQLGDVVPEVYGMALDRYNQEGQDLLAQYAMLGDMADDEYAKYQDSLNKYYTDLDIARTEVGKAYNKVLGFIGTGYTPSDSELSAAGLTREQYDAICKSAATSSGGSTGASILWTPTGARDGNDNVIFENSLGERKAFGEGVNPYTGTTHRDAKYGTFSNGYQPNNIGGTKLVNSGMSTNITGKNQTIWEANGKYWIWRGDLNQYVEVDISDLDD